MANEKTSEEKRDEFVEMLRGFIDDVETDGFGYIELGGAYIFCNKNYGEIKIDLGNGVNLSSNIY